MLVNILLHEAFNSLTLASEQMNKFCGGLIMSVRACSP